jgi:hypothetical protein
MRPKGRHLEIRRLDPAAVLMDLERHRRQVVSEIATVRREVCKTPSDGESTQPDIAGIDCLDELAAKIPELDDSEDWITNRAAAKLLGVDTETVANRRSKGDKRKSDGVSYGQHDSYCFWRKRGNEHPMYFLPRMKEHAGQLVEIFPKAILNRH